MGNNWEMSEGAGYQGMRMVVSGKDLEELVSGKWNWNYRGDKWRSGHQDCDWK